MVVSGLALAAALQAQPTPPSIPIPPPIVRVPSSPPPPPPPPPPAGTPQPARPRTSLALLVTPDDYPPEAIFNEEQGTVSFRLDVGADGRVRDCTVTLSSHSASLDETTCRIFRSRARFTPARDGAGRLAPGGFSSRIVWRIADDPVADGTGDSPEAVRAPPPFPVAAQRARPIAPLESYVGAADLPAEALGQPLVTSRFRLTVGPDGRVTECVPTNAGAPMALDEAACRLMRARARFTPGRDASGNAVRDSHRGHIRWSLFEPPPAEPTPL